MAELPADARFFRRFMALPVALVALGQPSVAAASVDPPAEGALLSSAPPAARPAPAAAPPGAVEAPVPGTPLPLPAPLSPAGLADDRVLLQGFSGSRTAMVW